MAERKSNRRYGIQKKNNDGWFDIATLQSCPLRSDAVDALKSLDSPGEYRIICYWPKVTISTEQRVVRTVESGPS